MKLKIISYDNLDALKSNLQFLTDNFKKDSNAWLEQEFGNNLFIDTKYPEIPDIVLNMKAKDPFDTEEYNVKQVYRNLKFLSESQASDERLWAGLCLGEFWKYVQYRWKINDKPTKANIEQHYLFGFGARRSLTRNAMARLWWIGRLTYDEKREDPWELTKFVCENSNYIMDILERNTSNNPMIIHEFIGAVLEARRNGFKTSKESVSDLSKYLNLLGGTYILDALPEGRIYSKILAKANEMMHNKNTES